MEPTELTNPEQTRAWVYLLRQAGLKEQDATAAVAEALYRLTPRTIQAQVQALYLRLPTPQRGYTNLTDYLTYLQSRLTDTPKPQRYATLRTLYGDDGGRAVLVALSYLSSLPETQEDETQGRTSGDTRADEIPDTRQEEQR